MEPPVVPAELVAVPRGPNPVVGVEQAVSATKKIQIAGSREKFNALTLQKIVSKIAALRRGWAAILCVTGCAHSRSDAWHEIAALSWESVD
jgi:hypothetical protein